mmetsp:Transcript_25324/g.80537  ORF Transcript_25324/g.80537 Transcript_25324/m.80537 type:complete len:202 (+) Transcript_25324:946-1551(+)
MAGSPLDRNEQCEGPRLRDARVVKNLQVLGSKSPMRQRSSLVQAHVLDLAEGFQVAATFDHDAVLGRVGKAADVAYRRRNDQRARACDNKQHERGTRELRPSISDRPRNGREPNGCNENQRRVNRSCTLYELLCRCAVRVRLDQVNDLARGGVLVLGRCHHLHIRPNVDGPCPNLLASSLTYWLGLPGQDRLVRHRARSFN